MKDYRTAGHDYKKDKGYLRWQRWMQLGEKTGCHQMPERSFFIHGYQMPVCARCLGVITGYLMAVPLFFVSGFHPVLSIIGSLVMFLDWLLQACGKLRSTNFRRLITGILGGFGIMSIELVIMKKFILYVIKFREIK